ncbi:sulfotransferase family protein [Maritimibacter sp. 55A14]|uniref:sulfotransferase family protein n=1 Tax=Maritimibacter sp. 55A14 TaxID=2174844 RepID=UPI000D60E5F6|nr:sulfotransferase family protein [Maritimibacter sp. 55A14]PWE31140.1 sulfotransferase family protein [Maritimibacter sp. 55A14]
MALEIIGAGFGRTGTNSLKRALEHLGFGPCHHMFEVRESPEQLALWQAAARGETPDWDRVFAGFRSQVDWPGARFWRELAAQYPAAKVILSVRDPDKWFDSVQATIGRFMADRGKHETAQENALAEMAHELVVRQIFDGRLDDRAFATKVFRDHVAAVKADIPPERLLVFEAGEGWPRLCDFLGVEVPDAPYPHTNTTAEYAARRQAAPD